MIALISGCGKKPEKTVLSFTSWGSKSEVAIIKPLISEFERKNSDIAIKFIHTPKNYFQKLHLLAASELMPDVVFINNINGILYAENNLFMSLNDFLDENFSDKTFFPKALNAFNYKGKQYAIPRDVSNLVIYYNKDIFDKYNVPYPSKDWTIDEFVNTSKKLTKDLNNDGKPDIYGVSFREEPLFWLPYLWSNGGGLISIDCCKKEIIIDKPESIEAIQLYADLRNKYHVAPTKSEAGSATMAQLFMQGKLAMHLSGRWFVPIYRKTIKFNWDITGFPAGKAGSIVGCDSSGWAISSKTKHPQQAWRFIQFLASKNSIEKFTQSGLITPARMDVANSTIFLDKTMSPENPEFFIKAIKNSIPTPVNKNYQEITDILDNAIEPVWLGKSAAQKAVNEDLIRKLEENL